MNLVPNPLHPALVHFPIVLLLLGGLVAVVAVFWRKHYVPALAAGLLLLGALGAWVAVQSGESDGGLLENTSAQVTSLVDAHETWAKRTLAISIAAGLAAAGSVLAARWPRFARVVAIVAALGGLAAAYAVFETGHRGGALVYRHAAGVEVAGNPAPGSENPAPAAAPRDKD